MPLPPMPCRSSDDIRYFAMMPLSALSLRVTRRHAELLFRRDDICLSMLYLPLLRRRRRRVIHYSCRFTYHASADIHYQFIIAADVVG